MDAGKPDPAPHVPLAPSLAARIAGALRSGAANAQPAADWRVGAALAALLAAGPLLTIAAAGLLAAKERDAEAALRARAAPAIAARAAAEASRGELAAMLARPTATVTLEALARVLPADASVLRAQRGKDGALAFDIATADPDRLRAALRRAPALAGLRNTGQRQGDGVLIVSFGQAAQ